jgi:UDPglucose--hexose-1-phosphate uridylyltransferase
VPELRKDPITRRWVIIANERAARPSDFPKGEPEAAPSATCPFCEGREGATPPEIAAVRRPGTGPNTPGWQVRVVPNKYPALRIEGTTDVTVDGLFERMGGVGAHEVIVETPDHAVHPALMRPDQLASVLWMYRERYCDLDRDPRFKYLLLFRNHGRQAGASLAHPHSQLIALPIVPKRAEEELAAAQAYFAREGRCVFCDILRQEAGEGRPEVPRETGQEAGDGRPEVPSMAGGEARDGRPEAPSTTGGEARDGADGHRPRVVWRNDEFVAFTPFASWCPFELWILPRRHTASFGALRDEQIMPLAEILQAVLGRLHACLSNPPYNYIIHTAPYDAKTDHFYHWHIEVLPRLSQVAGFEWGSGFYINTVPPEDAARYLRETKIAVARIADPTGAQGGGP